MLSIKFQKYPRIYSGFLIIYFTLFSVFVLHIAWSVTNWRILRGQSTHPNADNLIHHEQVAEADFFKIGYTLPFIFNLNQHLKFERHVSFL